MCKWRKIIKNLLPFIFLMKAGGLPAQEEKLAKAQQLLGAKNAEQAALVIDSVIAHPDTKGDFISWTTRAYIYFDLYKRTDRSKLNSALRDTIISSIRVSQSLSPDSVYKENNKKLLTNLAANYFNLGKTFLQDSLNPESSLVAYNRYKEVYLMADPAANLMQ